MEEIKPSQYLQTSGTFRTKCQCFLNYQLVADPQVKNYEIVMFPQQWSSLGHPFSRPHIYHRYHRFYLWRKPCHVEKFQISVKNSNNLLSFIEIYAVFVLNLCGEKMTNMRSRSKSNLAGWRPFFTKTI